ncbi:hypothetical protein [Priestia aryabhattai]
MIGEARRNLARKSTAVSKAVQPIYLICSFLDWLDFVMSPSFFFLRSVNL